MGRDTRRKQFVRSVLRERGAMLLDELRWLVLEREAADRRKTLESIARGPMQSFARTIRDHMPDVPIHDIPLGHPSECPLGLVATCAVYRLRERAKLMSFIEGSSPAIRCQLRTDLPVAEFGDTARYAGGSGFATPYYHLLLFDLYSTYEDSGQAGSTSSRQWVARVRIPPGHKVTIVGDRDPRGDALAFNPRWRLVGGAPEWPVYVLADT